MSEGRTHWHRAKAQVSSWSRDEKGNPEEKNTHKGLCIILKISSQQSVRESAVLEA